MFLIVVGVFDSFAPLTQVRDRIVDSKGDVVGVCGLAALKELRKQVKPYQLGRVFFLRRGFRRIHARVWPHFTHLKNWVIGSSADLVWTVHHLALVVSANRAYDVVG
jgi:hypothetical protein